MIIYIWNYISILLYAKIFKRRTFCMLVSMQMFLILALRADSVGVDLTTYKEAFDYISTLTYTDVLSRIRILHTALLPHPFDMESGWMILNWLISVLGFNFRILLVICAAINMYAIGTLIYRYSRIPWMSFCIIASMNTYFYMFGILRQSLALSFVILAIETYVKGNKIKPFLFWILAFLIHRTALLSIVLFIILKWDCRKKIMYKCILLGWIPFVASTSIIYSTAISRLMSLFQKAYIGHGAIFNNLMLLLLLIGVFIWFFFSFHNLSTTMETLCIWGTVAGIYWETIGMYNDVLARSIQYFLIFVSLSVPMVLSYYPIKKTSWIGSFAIYILLFIK